MEQEQDKCAYLMLSAFSLAYIQFFSHFPVKTSIHNLNQMTNSARIALNIASRPTQRDAQDFDEMYPQILKTFGVLDRFCQANRKKLNRKIKENGFSVELQQDVCLFFDDMFKVVDSVHTLVMCTSHKTREYAAQKAEFKDSAERIIEFVMSHVAEPTYSMSF